MTLADSDKNMWVRRGISTETKIKVYKAVVLTTLLYGSDSWTVYKRHAKKLHHFHTICLRKRLGIKWQVKMPDTVVLTRANLPSMHTILMQTLRLAGHVVRMADHRLPKKLPFGELHYSRCFQGGQKKRFKDTLKDSLKAFNIKYTQWEQVAMERPQWQSAVYNGAKNHEAYRMATIEQRRKDRKDSASKCSKATVHNAPEHFKLGLGSQIISVHPELEFPNLRMVRWSSSKSTDE